MIITFIYIKYNKVSFLDVPANLHFYMFMRTLLGFVGIQGLWISFKFLPLSIATCIFYVYPIFSVFFARCFLNEKIEKHDILQVFTSFIGVLIINNPFSADKNENQI